MRTVKHLEPSSGPRAVADRRIVLKGLIGTALAMAAAAAASADAYVVGPAALARWLDSDAARVLGDRTLLSRLGADYLTKTSGERDLRRLCDLLCDGSARPVEWQLIDLIARDWEEHHVAVAGGWVLSRSEARLCAALHLLDGARA